VIGAANLQISRRVARFGLGSMPNRAQALSDSNRAGRLEKVANNLDIAILVDYAIRRMLWKKSSCGAPDRSRKLITVFGCAAIATAASGIDGAMPPMSDVWCHVDNPRSEDPLAIIEEVEVGIRMTGSKSLARRVLSQVFSKLETESERRAVIASSRSAPCDWHALRVARPLISC